jgi:hypothetical protein
MFEFLCALGLQPIEWSQAVKATRTGTPYVGQVLDAAFARAAAACLPLASEWQSFSLSQ